MVSKTYGFVPAYGARKYLCDVTKWTDKEDVMLKQIVRNNDTRPVNEDADWKKRKLESDNASMTLNQQISSQETDNSRNTNKDSMKTGAS